MSKLQIINASRMEKILFDLGFYKSRQKGSHAFYRHSDGRTTVIPHHKKDLSRIIIYEILKDINISTDEYNILLHK